jgi:hypothetical protein
MMPRRTRTLTFALLLVLFIACAGGLPAEFPAPEFTLKSPLSGTEVSFASIKGKPIIIYWFTSW